MARITVHHLTLPKRLPLIEEEGLRTRADLSGFYGPPEEFDDRAPGTYANGKRVSFWFHEDYALGTVSELGAGYVTTTVDPAKVLAAPAAARQELPPAEYWEAAKPLKDWLTDGEPPHDLEIHQNVPVRAKHLQLRAPRFTDEQLGDFAPIVSAVADEDRLAAKALMHLALIASDADFDSPEFHAACAFAWRDEPDPDKLVRELMDLDPDKVVSAALAEYGGESPEAADTLREALESTRVWAEQNGMQAGQGLFSRTAVILDELPAKVVTTSATEE